MLGLDNERYRKKLEKVEEIGSEIFTPGILKLVKKL